MREKPLSLTDKLARSLPLPATGYKIHFCPETEGFGLRITAAGGRAWIVERRVNGKTVRRTIGKAAGRGAISCREARGLMIEINGELQRGIDRAKVQRAERKAEAQEREADALTLAAGLREYVDKKRRGKDGLPLKARTKADYLAMVEPGRTGKDGRPFADGELYELADRPLHKITADDMRRVFAKVLQRGERRAVYAMQVLRAVLNWHGVKVPGNPLGKEVAGREKIVLRPSAGTPNPIPPERLGAWWRAACAAGTEEVGGSREAGDYYRFKLLTGARVSEVLGDEHDNEPIRVRNVDLSGARIKLPDTKNRRDHVLLLSSQALEIVKRNTEGKQPDEPLFDISRPRRTLEAINRHAGVSVADKGLRSTFSSVAEELVSAYTVKRMVNHTNAGDVTGTHYISKSETQLRAGWQAVADFIEQRAGEQ